jgi:hypothetical protein
MLSAVWHVSHKVYTVNHCKSIPLSHALPGPSKFASPLAKANFYWRHYKASSPSILTSWHNGANRSAYTIQSYIIFVDISSQSAKLRFRGNFHPEALRFNEFLASRATHTACVVPGRLGISGTKQLAWEGKWREAHDNLGCSMMLSCIFTNFTIFMYKEFLYLYSVSRCFTVSDVSGVQWELSFMDELKLTRTLWCRLQVLQLAHLAVI